MCGHLKVAHHDVATPPPHKPDCVCVNSGEQERHVAYHSHKMCTNVFRLETDLCAGDLHCRSKELGYFGASDYLPLVLVVY